MQLLISLKVARLERALTQEEIAKQIGIPQSTYSRAERGLPVNPSAARKIARYHDRKPNQVWDFDTEAAAA
jgi:DNA-binding XRE family transcriptional regulator